MFTRRGTMILFFSSFFVLFFLIVFASVKNLSFNHKYRIVKHTDSTTKNKVIRSNCLSIILSIKTAINAKINIIKQSKKFSRSITIIKTND